MFLRILFKSFIKNRQRKLLAVIIIALGISIVSTLTNIWTGIEDKVSRELRVYGSNILLKAKTNTLPFKEVDSKNQLEDEALLDEADLVNLKTVFWRNNILAFAPYLQDDAVIKSENGRGKKFAVTGTWFDKKLDISTGESYSTGIKKIKSWWSIDGNFPRDQLFKSDNTEAILNKVTANQMGVKKGDLLTLSLDNNKPVNVKIVGFFIGDESDENKLYIPLSSMQRLKGVKNKFQWAEISALTTPDTDLARKYEKNPDSLSPKEYELWYCTAFVKSIALQAEEVVKGSEANPIRQISDSEGATLNKIKYFMLILMVLSFAISITGIWNLMSGYVNHRSNEVGLLKAIGASNLSLSALFLSEALILGFVGGVIGIIAGNVFSSIIGFKVFGESISANVFSVILSLLVSLAVALIGNLSAVAAVSRLNTKDVLHGG